MAATTTYVGCSKTPNAPADSLDKVWYRPAPFMHMTMSVLRPEGRRWHRTI